MSVQVEITDVDDMIITSKRKIGSDKVLICIEVPSRRVELKLSLPVAQAHLETLTKLVSSEQVLPSHKWDVDQDKSFIDSLIE